MADVEGNGRLTDDVAEDRPFLAVVRGTIAKLETAGPLKDGSVPRKKVVLNLDYSDELRNLDPYVGLRRFVVSFELEPEEPKEDKTFAQPDPWQAPSLFDAPTSEETEDAEGGEPLTDEERDELRQAAEAQNAAFHEKIAEVEAAHTGR